MNVVVSAEARAVRRAVGVTAWAVLEEALLDARVEGGELVADTNVRKVAAQLGVSKDTAARAVARLTRAGLVRRVVAERGTGGALPTSRYVIDVVAIDGVTTSVDRTAPAAPQPSRCPARRSPRIDDAQPALFDLPDERS